LDAYSSSVDARDIAVGDLTGDTTLLVGWRWGGDRHVRRVGARSLAPPRPPARGDVADVGRRLLGRAEVEVLEDLADRERVGDVGHRLERPSTASVDELLE
jgi:hypothetical protein